ncbi:MAG: homocysteine methyltransferase [Clostridia bacterium]|nr:homocysteine methyltransferase [Clostridia bacterium]
MDIRKLLGTRVVFFDGGMGTLLQERGLEPGGLPELWNIEHPEVLTEIHRAYRQAGADIATANTFGANRLKLAGSGHDAAALIAAAIANARAAMGADGLVALDIGPTGKLLQPLGDLSFDDAYAAFADMVKAGAAAGADLILIETMSDAYELKAAVLAAKENCDLPVFATVVFDEKGKLLTGGNVPGVVALLEGLGVDALGVNCGLGPVQMAPFVSDLLRYASVPVIVNPNAGLPKFENGQTTYDIDADTFAKTLREFAEQGAWVLGGCCGTTPDHIRALHAACAPIAPQPITQKDDTIVTSYARAVIAGNSPLIIGERINPTGKSRFKQALRDGDINYILGEGFAQQDSGAHILDINVGLPEIDEPDMMVRVMREVQAVIDLPLQIDTSNTVAMERALRYYNGKAMVNSVNGKRENMEAVFPLVAKYGGVVVGLALDEGGIPQTAEGRFAVAKKIVETAATYGIPKKNIVIDVLCMTVSADRYGAVTTLEALRRVREELGVKTILGVSNISFGLPQRPQINATFYTMALQNGLDFGIINPNSEDMMRAYHGYRALAGIDENCTEYITQYGNAPKAAATTEKADMTLGEAIEKGLQERAHVAATTMLETQQPLEIIDGELIPALDRVGKRFETGELFLPQLLMSAEAAKAAFEVIKLHLSQHGGAQQKRGKVILATVKGDVHDIGKNIVKVLLENYSFDVLDLGKDVDPQLIVDTALREDVRIVGLSALMTTTVPSMAETIRRLRQDKPDCKIMVGGAVLTQEYADMIGADCYSKDAMGSIHFAQKVLT